jgi:hypothetical protein
MAMPVLIGANAKHCLILLPAPPGIKQLMGRIKMLLPCQIHHPGFEISAKVGKCKNWEILELGNWEIAFYATIFSKNQFPNFPIPKFPNFPSIFVICELSSPPLPPMNGCLPS